MRTPTWQQASITKSGNIKLRIIVARITIRTKTMIVMVRYHKEPKIVLSNLLFFIFLFYGHQKDKKLNSYLNTQMNIPQGFNNLNLKKTLSSSKVMRRIYSERTSGSNGQRGVVVPNRSTGVCSPEG
jgi:hypothetical protein